MADETDEEKAAREEAEEAAKQEAADAAKREEEGWAKLSDIVDKAVEKRLSSWSGPQSSKTKKTTSSHSPQKQAGPKRKQGFLSGQFFSNLGPKTDEE